MKIGIITMSGGQNYGCALQTFAVIKAYEALGHEAVLIPDTTSNGVRSQYQHQSKLSKLKPTYAVSALKVRMKNKYFLKNQRDKLLPEIIGHKKNSRIYISEKQKRAKVFHDFYKNYIPQTDFTINKNDLSAEKLKDFDFFSAGSDQIWNPTYPHTSEIKFLTFANNNQKLTFAPSFGISELPEYAKAPYREWLSQLPFISVREQSGADIIKELTGKDASVICDPTLTISRETWESIESKPCFDCSKPYALTYFLGNESNCYRRYIDKVAKEKGLQVINLFDIRESEFYCTGPSEFIYLIHHADAVFTDSFHAAVFSIIFKKDFVVFDRIEDGRSMGSRLKTLLNKFSLSDRMYNSVLKSNFIETDFSRTDEILKTEKAKALEFLKNSINYNPNN